MNHFESNQSYADKSYFYQMNDPQKPTNIDLNEVLESQLKL